jgi:DNA helicase HerA-like ATPase
VSAEVASTRLPKEILREIDREAARRGISRSVYLADVIERGALREPPADAAGAAEVLRVAITSELREIREGQRNLSQTLRDILAALTTGTFASGAAGSGVASAAPAGPAVLDRLMFSTFFSEALLKRVSALLYRNPGELSQVVREAREQAEAEAKLWRERLPGPEKSKGSS